MNSIYQDFKKLTDDEDDPSVVKSLIGKTEDLYLECKTIPRDEIDGNFITNRKFITYFNYGKALSAFANAEGGLIVWGLFAKSREKSEPDSIVEERPVTHVTKVKTDLDSITGKVVSRRVVGVQNRIVYSDKVNDIGFIVTYVPKSDEAPHRVEGERVGSRRYYRRHGNGSYEMEHYELEEMFGGRTRPKLKVVASYYLGETGAGKKKCFVRIGLRNVGMSVAKYPLLEVVDAGQFTKEFYGVDGNGHTGLPIVVANRKYQGGISDVIHIDDIIWVDKYSSVYNDIRDDNKRNMRVRIACDGFRIRFVDVRLEIDNPTNQQKIYEFGAEDDKTAEE